MVKSLAHPKSCNLSICSFLWDFGFLQFHLIGLFIEYCEITIIKTLREQKKIVREREISVCFLKFVDFAGNHGK